MTEKISFQTPGCLNVEYYRYFNARMGLSALIASINLQKIGRNS